MSAPNERQVAAFGRRWLDRLFGEAPDLTVAFAGGAFRQLVDGRPPRDIDLWFPGPEQLHAACALLQRRGASIERDNPPYQIRFLVEGTPVELVYNVHPGNLDELFSSFDLGPSMMGVWRRGGVDLVQVHPLATRSIEERCVLVNRGFSNGKYALICLERLERYAEELGFAVSEADRRWLWSIFDGATPDEQARMVERFHRAEGKDPRILYRAMTTGAWKGAA